LNALAPTSQNRNVLANNFPDSGPNALAHTTSIPTMKEMEAMLGLPADRRPLLIAQGYDVNDWLNEEGVPTVVPPEGGRLYDPAEEGFKEALQVAADKAMSALLLGAGAGASYGIGLTPWAGMGLSVLFDILSSPRTTGE